MDYTSIHIHGHLLSDDILHQIETDKNLEGNRDNDFFLDTSVQEALDYAWTALRADWGFYLTRSLTNDSYGTRRSREFMERLLLLFGFHPQRQQQYVESETGTTHNITWLCPDLGNFPIIVKGDKTGNAENDSLERCSLDFRSKGSRKEKSAHAGMLEYLNNTENIYGIIANGPTLRLIRNSGQLVKQTYIEFDIRRMLEEDKYAEFSLMFRVLHASRFKIEGDNQSIIEKYFNLSIESGNRIREGLSQAAQQAMEIIGNAALNGQGEGNDKLRSELSENKLTVTGFNKELMHLIYRLLFLFIIEDRDLVYDGDSPDIQYWKEIYNKYYAVTRYRNLSEVNHIRNRRYDNLWVGLMETFRLFEDENFGGKLGIKPLGGILFNPNTLEHLKDCNISNEALFDALRALNLFKDENGQWVKVNYSSLDVEEFGSVYEGILEKRPELRIGNNISDWKFSYVGGLDRQSTSSYYTRPDLVQSLIRTTLEPVIEKRLSKLKTPEEKVSSLLSMKVCDAASGSGHIVLAMARTIAWYVSSIRSGEDNPASMEYRRALHDVIEKCVYAVDYNPDAVELCKVVLWIEGYCAGKPLSFLDHHIRCGNSVVGVSNLDTLLQGVPDKAFSAVDKEVLKKIKALNKTALQDIELIKTGRKFGRDVSLFGSEFNMTTNLDEEQISLGRLVKEINALPENDLLEQLTKKKRWEDLMTSPRVECLRRACDIFVDSFYHNFTEEDITVVESTQTLTDIPFTKTVYQALEEIKKIEDPDLQYIPLSDEFKREISHISNEHRFFHWCVEFPEVFANGSGFDVMCGNPPWDKIKVEDKKWFESHGRLDIVNAGNASQRKRAIEKLSESDPSLYSEYLKAIADAESMSRFVRFGGRFPLTATGDIDLYPMFGELCLNFSKEAWGLVLPTGIAVNDSNKAFFSKLVDENRLISLYDFENKEGLFDIHRMFKFCLLTAGSKQNKPRDVKAGFYLTRIDHLLDPNRIYILQTSDFTLLNPNTKTCPVFRTSKDAELTTKIYRNCGHIIYNESTGENPWGIKFGNLFHMSGDSNLYYTHEQLSKNGAILKEGNFINSDNEIFVPLYEGKMIWFFNNHYGTWPITKDRPNSIDSPSLFEMQNPYSKIIPWYWISLKEVESKIKYSFNINKCNLLAYRRLTGATNERTLICCTMPQNIGMSDSLTYIHLSNIEGLIIQAFLSSFTMDYISRTKLNGNAMSGYFVKQFPIKKFDEISDTIKWEISKRVIQLQYFNHDLDDWAESLWKELTPIQQAEIPNVGRKEPFIYNYDRRAILQAELDAIVAHLYGLTTDELRYILDPEDICGTGCINETFRVLKDREIREFGEYRTKRLVLEAWHRFHYDN